MYKNFKITPIQNKTISWWYSKRSKIDMNPPYQRRGRLWSSTDKAYLIDSIINGYDIPKIYVADFTWGESIINKKNLPYAIIDGKQRFEAIFDFFDGNIVLNDDFLYLEKPSLKLGGLGYKDLLLNYQDIADDFQNYNLMVIGVYAKKEAPITELFVRLNRSKALTGAEIRNAMAGPAPELIRQIASHEFFSTNIRFDVKRGQDLNASAKLLLFEYEKDFQETTKSRLDKFVKETAIGSKERLELAGRHTIDNLDDLSSIFLPKDILLNSAGTIPVYYWLVKNLNEKDYSKVREFINDFEKERKNNRRLVREEPDSKNIKPFLVEYDNFNRSTNNQQSHRERYRILLQKFQKYLVSGNI